jgi:trk system potassium uptake protein TrkH
MHDILFEQVSAFGTVGLSTGLTPRLTAAGKLWIAATMFVGRLGPLTIAVSAFARRTPAIRCPEGRIMIG